MPFNPVQALLEGQNANAKMQQHQLQQQLMQQSQQPGFDPLNNQAIQQLTALNPQLGTQSLQTFVGLSEERQKTTFQAARKTKRMLESGNVSGALRFIGKRLSEGSKLENFDPSDTLEIQQDILAGNVPEALSKLGVVDQIGVDSGLMKPIGGTGRKRSESEFESLVKQLPQDKQNQAVLVKLGLEPRAVGDAIQTITSRGIAEAIGKSKATIKQREKFGEMTGSSRAKAIDNGFEKILKIDAGINNINNAVTQLRNGAGVGSIERFLPSFKAASVALDNVQKSMALDVIGSVTFGALSQGELDLAKEVALPTGLDTPQLIQHLEDRKNAQEKLRAYYNEQIQFLDNGGTVAGFLRKKESERTQQPQQQTQEAIQSQQPSSGGFKILSIE